MLSRVRGHGALATTNSWARSQLHLPSWEQFKTRRMTTTRIIAQFTMIYCPRRITSSSRPRCQRTVRYRKQFSTGGRGNLPSQRVRQWARYLWRQVAHKLETIRWIKLIQEVRSGSKLTSCRRAAVLRQDRCPNVRASHRLLRSM